MSIATGAPVNVQVRLDAEASGQIMVTLSAKIEAAIQRAIERTKAEVYAFATGSSSQVPVKTGALKGSFAVASTPRSIVFKWSASSPKGYDYALIQDVGGANRYGYIAGKYYSEVTKQFARDAFKAALEDELRQIGVVP